LDLIGPDAQHLLFSATLDGDVDKIVRTYLDDPVRHSIAVDESRMEAMEHFVLGVHPSDKQQIVAEIASRAGLTIMFARTQLGVERIANELMAEGVACGALHGGKTQAARTKTLNQFKDGTTSVLVATDVAARGIHVDGVSLVVHIDPPKDPKDYVHRAGRTARAGAEGTVVTLVNPRSQRTVLDMMSKAGVEPTVIRVRPMDEALVQVTGAREPSGTPWRPPAEKRKSGGRPPGRSGGRPSGGGGRSRSPKPRS
jgi:superfamily II DNA/RNA helicase